MCHVHAHQHTYMYNRGNVRLFLYLLTQFLSQSQTAALCTSQHTIYSKWLQCKACKEITLNKARNCVTSQQKREFNCWRALKVPCIVRILLFIRTSYLTKITAPSVSQEQKIYHFTCSHGWEQEQPQKSDHCSTQLLLAGVSYPLKHRKWGSLWNWPTSSCWHHGSVDKSCHRMKRTFKIKDA